MAWAGPAQGWVEYDPTNAQWAGEDYITVAIGRDYAAGLLAAMLQGEQTQLRQRRCLFMAKDAEDSALFVQFVENDVHLLSILPHRLQRTQS